MTPLLLTLLNLRKVALSPRWYGDLGPIQRAQQLLLEAGLQSSLDPVQPVSVVEAPVDLVVLMLTVLLNLRTLSKSSLLQNLKMPSPQDSRRSSDPVVDRVAIKDLGGNGSRLRFLIV